MKLRKQLVCLVVGSLLLSTGHEAVAQEDEAKPKVPPPARIPTLPVPLRSAPEPKAEAEKDEEVDTVVQGTEDLELPQFETGVEFKAMSPRTKVTFNLEDADLSDLVRLISNMTGRRFILPSKLRTIKATVFAPTKVTVSEAYQAFLSVLEVNGYTIVPAGRYLKIEELAGYRTNHDSALRGRKRRSCLRSLRHANPPPRQRLYRGRHQLARPLRIP